MNYLEYIQKFPNLRLQNEKVHSLQKIYDSNIEDFI